MKNISLILVFALILQQYINAQEFVSESKLWSSVSWGTENPEYITPYFIKFSGDTLIEGEWYKNILRCDDSLQISWKTIGQIREDGSGKVYWLGSTYSEDEVLLYDFSLEEGDSIQALTSEYLKVDSVRYRYFGSSTEKLKFVYLQYKYTWIEGVGSTNGVLNGLPYVFICGEAGKLICYYENSALIYHDVDYSSCFPVNPSGINDRIPQLSQNTLIHVFTGDSHIRFNFNELQTSEALLRIYDLNGREMEVLCLNGEKQIELADRPYSPGLYLFLFENDELRLTGKFVLQPAKK